MPAPLKDRIDAAAIAAIAARCREVADVDVKGFMRLCAGFEDLELKERAAHIAAALAKVLPSGDEGLAAFIEVLAEPLAVDPLVYFVHSALLLELQRDADFDLAVAANVALTERFTAEFSLRPLLDKNPERAIAHLQALAASTNVHHRRLVSEGTRPRLPWAPRLQTFGASEAIDELLVLLGNDPDLYVRRSVANHIGDIAKDDIERALHLCGAINNRWVTTHALRHPVKGGDARALALLGFALVDGDVSVVGDVQPAVVHRGEDVNIKIVVENRGADVNAVIDLLVGFAKKSAGPSFKAFKLKTALLKTGAKLTLAKTLATRDLSTRVHWPGEHPVVVQVNGRRFPIGSFTLR